MIWAIGIGVTVVGYIVINIAFDYLVEKNILKEDK